MPLDKVEITIQRDTGSLKISDFKSYRIQSDLFEAGDAFEFVIDPDISVFRGDRLKVFVNNQLELTAVLNRPQRSYYKQDTGERLLRITGVDMMGLLTGHHISEGKTYHNYSTEDIVNELISNVPFLNRQKIMIHAGAKTDTKKITDTNPFSLKSASSKDIFRTVPGETVFEALKRFALSKGVLFYGLPNGTLILGGLIASGTPSYFLNKTNIISMEESEDPGSSYSSVTILGSMQAQEAFSLSEIRATATITDDGFPYEKPYVAVSEQGGDSDDLKKQAALLMAQQKIEESGLTYRTQGHSQGRNNWQINTIVRVNDIYYPDLNGDYLIAGRTFEMDKDTGTTTTLRLTKPGFSPRVA